MTQDGSALALRLVLRVAYCVSTSPLTQYEVCIFVGCEKRELVDFVEIAVERLLPTGYIHGVYSMLGILQRIRFLTMNRHEFVE